MRTAPHGDQVGLIFVSTDQEKFFELSEERQRVVGELRATAALEAIDDALVCRPCSRAIEKGGGVACLLGRSVGRSVGRRASLCWLLWAWRDG